MGSRTGSGSYGRVQEAVSDGLDGWKKADEAAPLLEALVLFLT